MLKTRLHARFGVNCQQKIKQDRIAAKDAYFVRVIPFVRLHDLRWKGSSLDKGLKNDLIGDLHSEKSQFL